MAKKAESTSSQTELAIIPSSNFAALVPQGDLAEAMTAMAEVGEEMRPEDLIKVKLPSGGGTQWEIPSAMGIERTDSITGVLVGWQKCGLLWPNDDPIEGQKPVLRTMDLQTAEQVGPIPDDMVETLEKHRLSENTFDWKELPYNQWNTGKDGVGKRCKEQRIMFILREQDIFPLVITAGAGSLKTVVPWYTSTQQLRVVWYRLIVELTLKKASSKSGIGYSQIIPKAVGKVSKEDGVVIYERWTQKLVQLSREIVVDGEVE